MRFPTRLLVGLAATALLFCGAVTAQHDHDHKQHSDQAQAKASAPAAYPLGTCPISGKKLGAMGEPVVKVYDGREVRFCCGGCPKRFEKDLSKSFAALDARIVADQKPLYPMKTSLVTGKALPANPVEFVYGNRLIRVGSEKEKAAFVKHATKYLAALDQAVIAAQREHYPLKTCPISGEELGSMGKPLDRVVFGRLVRLCCKGCLKKLNKDPMAAIAKVEAARAGGHEHAHGEGKKGHHHGGH